MPPPVSVVIPLYNKEKFIARCIASIQAQTHPAAEIIIVNDGSTDQSLKVVQHISDPRLRLFDCQNGGVSAARNFGLAQATHEHVALLDADDEWDPRFLETMSSLIGKFPDAGLYYTAHLNRVGGDKVVNTAIPSLPPGYSGYLDIFEYNTDQGPWSSATVIRKSLLGKTGGFDSNLIKGEDTDLWIRFALNGRIAFHNTPLSICHDDDANRAMSKPCPPLRCLITNLDKYAAAARNNLQFHKYLQSMRVGHICNFLGGYPCELADPHREIENLDLDLLPRIWKLIRHSPRSLRGFIFKSHMYGGIAISRLSDLLRRRDKK